MPNAVGHFEFAVNNLQEGIEFYSKLFGWDIRHDKEMDYGMISTGEKPGGGIFKVPDGQKPFITIYVEVDDIETKLNEASQLGGTITVPKSKISDEHGYYGMFSDPDGNMIGLWSKQ